MGEILGGCLVESVVGRGAMGVVYQARHLLMERHVAIKVLNDQLSADGQMLTRFVREARTASQINHPNLIQVYDSGVRDGKYFFVMEFVSGETLEDLLKSRGALPAEELVDYAIQTCGGLAVAHNAGVIHRDIKPANLLVKDGHIKISDFGLARDLGGDTSITQTGQLLGSPRYMSPEQCRCDPLDTRSDIYALGVTMYHMLTGEPPFDGPITLVLMKHLNQEPTPLQEVNPEVPVELGQIVLRMMAKDPANRYAKVEDVAAVLEAHRTGESSAATAVDNTVPGSGVHTARGTAQAGRGSGSRGRTKRPKSRRNPARATRTTGVHQRRRTGRSNNAGVLAVGAVFIALVLVLILIVSGDDGPSEEERAAEVAREDSPGEERAGRPGPTVPRPDAPERPTPPPSKTQDPTPAGPGPDKPEPPVDPPGDEALAAYRALRTAIEAGEGAQIRTALSAYRNLGRVAGGERQVELAAALLNEGMLSEAAAELARLPSLEPVASDVRLVLNRIQAEAVALMEPQLPDASFDGKLATRLQRLDPDYYFYHLPVGIRLGQRQQWKRAIHHLSMALSLGRRVPTATYHLYIARRMRAYCFLRSDQPKAALDETATLIPMVRAQRIAEVLRWRFDAQMHLAQWEEARRTVGLAMKFPGDGFADPKSALARVVAKAGGGEPTDADISKSYIAVCQVTSGGTSELRPGDVILKIDDEEPLEFATGVPQQLRDLAAGRRIEVKVLVLRGRSRTTLTLRRRAAAGVEGRMYVRLVGTSQ